jgi:glycosyltransferase involved in cell wall biosynthesis
VVAGLVKQFPKVRYEIAGNGREFEEAKKMIKDLALEKNVRLLGELKNPYGRMKEADLLLIPSFAEAAPLVIGEAASLGTPVLSTKTSSSEEMIESTGYGWVCENSEEGIRNGLLAILKHPSLIREKKTELLNRKFTDRKAVQRFSDLMTACKKEGI